MIHRKAWHVSWHTIVWSLTTAGLIMGLRSLKAPEESERYLRREVV